MYTRVDMAVDLSRSTKYLVLKLVDLSTVALTESSSRKSICPQTLKVGANDRSAQELQNGL
jgi:hypothetical protein